ncbi:TPA: kinase [Streptococcus equi subsp. zooepidemicus]|uniref:kinase n=1 Tax=Streptococcus equi TaxID=1336 RepID=UPI00197EE80D|nr:kinase [Streptococcus equi]QUQ80819.1 hypothetical protein LJFMMFNO_01874 [Streptococcus equi subsp. zooepidemicus]HEL1067157.1 kinase [Streptococcus equi subsp. zooepidemicus]HEL1069362.1 kinase [Streptococcus equi subsp. zooepidemicus]HEL1136194.1 kinase [Streptococcus equi subsp. zooepidemicus]HEL1255035.1 kinase [Streptococcus equi subsp. zooepidemicus]
MTTLIIIRGNAASGKTSLAKALQTALGEKTLLLSQDQLRRDMLHARDGFDTPTISLILNLLDYGQQHCDYIILEGILRADWYQPVWEKITELFPDRYHAYYYDLPFEETLYRHSTRAKSSEFGEAELRRWWNHKDYLSQLTEQTITANLSLEEALEYILTAVSKKADHR